MKKTTLVSSSIIAASLFGAALIAPPMNVNPLQPQVVQADSLAQDDEAALKSKLSNLFQKKEFNIFNFNKDDSSFRPVVNSFAANFPGANNKNLYETNPISDNTGQIVNDKGIYKINSKYITNAFNPQLNWLNLTDSEKLLLSQLKFSISSDLHINSNRNVINPGYDYHATKGNSMGYASYATGVDMKDNGGSVSLTYTITGPNNFNLTTTGTLTYNANPLDFQVPPAKPLKPIEVKGSDMKRNYTTGIQGPHGYETALIDSKTNFGDIKDSKGNVVSDLNNLATGDYTQIVKVNFKDILGDDDYNEAIGMTSIRGLLLNRNDSVKTEGFDYNTGIYTYERQFHVIKTVALSFNYSDGTIGEKVGADATKYNNPESVDFKSDNVDAFKNNITLGKIIPDVKNNFTEIGNYTQDITINVDNILKQHPEYSSVRINGIDYKSGTVTYPRKFNVTNTIQPLEFSVAVPKDISEKFGNSTSPYTNKNDFKITVMSGKEKDTDIANNASVSLIKENGVAADQTFTEGAYYQELKIDLNKLFGTNYAAMMGNLTINGHKIQNGNNKFDEHNELSNGFYIVKRKITVPTPKQLTITEGSKLKQFEENANTKDTQDQIQKEISNSISAKGYTINSSAIKLGDIFYNNSTRPYDKGTLDTGEYDQIVKIDLKDIFGDDYIAAALNVSFNGKLIEKQDLDTDGWFQFKKHFTVGKTTPSQPPVKPTKPTQPVSPSPTPQPTAPAVVTPTQPTPDNKPAVTDEDLNGVVTILNGSSFQYAQIFDDNGNVVVDRYLALNSAWKTDRRRLINGTYYYRVSTHEYVRLDQVIYTDTPTKSTWIDTGITRSDMAANVFQVTEPQAYLWEISADGQRLNQKPDRLLVTGSSWKTGQKLVIDGATFYQVSTNEWVKETKGYLVK
ncbi:hypothetical protein [Bombilactobacillus bombi]|uniref:hypothetical protein n=1 Tax=Bombilactobacillus bombi TaxID=1303590 RepID=UPI0035EA4579